MSSLWIDLTPDDRMASVQATAAKRKIDERAVEKDWWVTAVLKALFHTDCAPWLNFKGGTSLSKGWSLIDRFSEDADLREMSLKIIERTMKIIWLMAISMEEQFHLTN